MKIISSITKWFYEIKKKLAIILYTKHVVVDSGRKIKGTNSVLKPFWSVLKAFIVFGAVNGFIINFILWALIGMKFTVYTLLAWGWTYWFIRYEFKTTWDIWKGRVRRI